VKISNSELSWLEFNGRILQEARDKSVPLMQRLRFLGIFSNNQDEFVKVRLSNIIRSSRIKSESAKIFSGGYTAYCLLKIVNEKILNCQNEFAEIYTEILEEMAEKNIHITDENSLDEKQQIFCRNYFENVVSPLIAPVILRKKTEIPFLRDDFYFAVKLTTMKGKIRYALIRIPVSESCPRFVVLPKNNGKTEIIFLENIIRLCMNSIFFMFNCTDISAHVFTFVRDAYFSIDEDISKSLTEKMEAGLDRRLNGQPVKLIYEPEIPDDLLDFIAVKLNIKKDGNFMFAERYHLMRNLMDFPEICPATEKTESATPLRNSMLKPFSSIFKAVDKNDVFLNYPYHTFNHFIDFLKEAAIDPKVDSIYITLYRLAENSQVVNTLINAVKNGKQVTALVELFARFDEERNTGYSELLQKEGIKIIHGIAGLKVHGKIVLVKCKKKGYVYLGTGNFNEVTARTYSDFGLFTSDRKTVADAVSVFGFLQNIHAKLQTEHLIVAPVYMRNRFEELINREIRNARKGLNAFIYAKFNSLTDGEMIKLLYRASAAGVKIRLIVRGACCLQPQTAKYGDNIEAIRIIDKYLEHARMIVFCNAGDEKFYITSADFMERNLDRRIEFGIEITSPDVKQTLKDIFNIQWNDNVKARDLNNKLHETGNTVKLRSQDEFFRYFAAKNRRHENEEIKNMSAM
jgi:polyphosphate kinase